jgi:endonuclease/exonuclease/phosphatase family metal-dependent hydrolase
VTRLRPGLPALPDPPVRPTLRVLTVNIHKGFSAFNRRFVLPELRDAVRSVGADLVCLQEVHGERRQRPRHARRTPPMPHYEFLADTLWTAYAYGRNAVTPDGDHGNAVLSRYPIVAWTNHDVTADRREPRGLLHCTLDVPDGGPRVHAICVHLGLREGERRQQVDGLFALIASAVPPGAPLVVAGDFNDWRGQVHRTMVEVDLHEVHADAGRRLPRTFPAGLPVLRLDRIYVRGAVRTSPLALPRLPWAHLSDHIPLAAHVQF